MHITYHPMQCTFTFTGEFKQSSGGGTVKLLDARYIEPFYIELPTKFDSGENGPTLAGALIYALVKLDIYTYSDIATLSAFLTRPDTMHYLTLYNLLAHDPDQAAGLAKSEPHSILSGVTLF